MIASAGACVLYLPPYSPDFNPIEMAFSKIKQSLRSLAARNRDSLWQNLQPILDRISTSDAQAFFKHAGYGTQEK